MLQKSGVVVWGIPQQDGKSGITIRRPSKWTDFKWDTESLQTMETTADPDLWKEFKPFSPMKFRKTIKKKKCVAELRFYVK